MECEEGAKKLRNEEMAIFLLSIFFFVYKDLFPIDLQAKRLLKLFMEK